MPSLIIPFELPLPKVLPTIEGNVDYRTLRDQLLQINQMLLISGLEDQFIEADLKQWLQGRKAVSGAEQLIGSEAVVLSWKEGQGFVWAQGERWSARGDRHFAPGQKLKIRRLNGLTLLVSAT